MSLPLNKKILIIVATHGDEPIGVAIAERLKSSLGPDKERVDFLMANPRAYAIQKRFIDADLNRVYPGRARSKRYEERRAVIIYKLASRYRYLIDIHQLAYGRENLIIVPKDKISDEELIKRVGIKKVIFWPSTSGRATGPLAQFFTNCLELEIATAGKSYQQVVDDSAIMLRDFIKNIDQPFSKAPRQTRYLVYDRLLVEAWPPPLRLRDFKRTNFRRETFYPLLVNQYLARGIVCYKMKKYNPNKRLTNKAK